MDFDKDTPLNRVANETIKAHTALMDYWQIGAGRSLVNLCQIYTKPMPDPEPPTVHIATLKVWSSRYHWQARIARQIENENAVTLERRRQTLEQIEEQYRQRHMSEAEALALLADQARGNMADFAGVRAQSDLADNPKAALVKNIVQHYTQTTKGTDEDSEAEIKARIALGLYDAQRALEMILKHHGSFEKDNKSELSIKLADSPLDKINRALDSIAA
ncbi:hypothetical protein LCGC14_1300080, partial [marine sediment metagenome]